MHFVLETSNIANNYIIVTQCKSFDFNSLILWKLCAPFDIYGWTYLWEKYMLVTKQWSSAQIHPWLLFIVWQQGTSCQPVNYIFLEENLSSGKAQQAMAGQYFQNGYALVFLSLSFSLIWFSFFIT